MFLDFHWLCKDYHPLQNLTKKDVAWKYIDKERRAIDSLKQALAEDKVMTYFEAP
jgi:hypothetical protein